MSLGRYLRPASSHLDSQQEVTEVISGNKPLTFPGMNSKSILNASPVICLEGVFGVSCVVVMQEL